MTDYDSIWRTQDEIRTVVNAVLGECIWNLSYSERRMAIELELTVTLDDDAISNLCCQFPITADYDGIGSKGSKFAFYLLYSSSIRMMILIFLGEDFFPFQNIRTCGTNQAYR